MSSVLLANTKWGQTGSTHNGGPLISLSALAFIYVDTVKVEIMVGRKYSASAIWPWGGHLNIAKLHIWKNIS